MRERKAVRWLVMDPQARVLLFRFCHATGPLTGHDYWATPGGGVEEGETFEAAAIRELHEETGIRTHEAGPAIAHRNFIMQMPDGEHVRGVEQYFALRTEQRTLSRDGWTEQEREVIAEYRWWAADELRSTTETVWPENLLDMLAIAVSPGQAPVLRLADSTDAVQLAQVPLYLTTSSANTASRKLAEAVGFRLVRTLVGDRQSDAFGVCDTLLFKWPVVRPATLNDAAQIAQVHVRSWQQAYSQLMPQAYLTGLDQTLSQRRGHWAETITRGDSQVRVVSLEDALIGWICFGPSRDTDVDARQVGEVMALYVLAEHWGHGIGRRLWQAARAWLGEQGYERITLWVLVENTRAIRFYQACGWVEEPQTRRTLQRGGVTLEEVRYSGSFSTRRGE